MKDEKLANHGPQGSSTRRNANQGRTTSLPDEYSPEDTHVQRKKLANHGPLRKPIPQKSEVATPLDEDTHAQEKEDER